MEVKTENKIEVILFGLLAEKAGQQHLELETPENLSELRKLLNALFPKLKDQAFRIAVNQEVVAEDHKIKPGDEVALLPPYAGG